MKRILLYVIACVCLAMPIHAASYAVENELYDEMYELCSPYLMPDTHHLKPILDDIFSKSRVTFDTASCQDAGFEILYEKKRSFIRVVRHPQLPGYLLKVYFDTETRIKYDKPGWQWLVDRCRGAKQLKHTIANEKSKYFQVPEKWLYAIPTADFPSDMPGIIKQPVLLVVEDMQLVSKEENLTAWKEAITREHLDEMFRITTQGGGSSYRASNVWLSKNGKFSFIDTEYPEDGQSYRSIRPYLSKEMKAYWDTLVKQG